MKTPEQKQADKAMDDAIRQAVKAYGCLDSRANMVSWVAVVEGQYWDDDDDMLESWGLLYPDGQARSSVAIGLLTIGMDLVSDGERVPEDDE